MQPFDRSMLELAFKELGTRAWSLGRTVEIAVYAEYALWQVPVWTAKKG